MRAFIFPGQGSQAVGMGVALAEASLAAREVFEEVDEAIGQHLFRLMKDGPLDALTLTENAQPAIMANAIATWRVLEREGGVRLAEQAAFVAGHSLGEYSALCAAGALDLATTARLLKRRGQAMQSAVPVGVGALHEIPEERSRLKPLLIGHSEVRVVDEDHGRTGVGEDGVDEVLALQSPLRVRG